MRAEGDGSAARSWLQAPLGVWASIPYGTTRRQVSRGGGEESRFSRSGTELFFVAVGAPGDDRFLMIKLPPVPPLVMAEHWFTELRAKLRP